VTVEVEGLKKETGLVGFPDWSSSPKSFPPSEEEKAEQTVREQVVASRQKFSCERGD